MDLVKHLEYFNPETLRNAEIHVIGLGAIGSHVCEMMARTGILKIDVYDFDTVEEHNLANQNYFADDIGLAKTEATAKNCNRINPEMQIRMHNKGWEPGTRLSGFVFICVDNIDLRRQIVTDNQYNTTIDAMFDFRMGLEDAQHYACDWSKQENIEAFLSTMNFTHEEAKEAMPISACGTTLSIAATVKSIVCDGISNWINFVRTKQLSKLIMHNAFKYQYLNM